LSCVLAGTLASTAQASDALLGQPVAVTPVTVVAQSAAAPVAAPVVNRSHRAVAAVRDAAANSAPAPVDAVPVEPAVTAVRNSVARTAATPARPAAKQPRHGRHHVKRHGPVVARAAMAHAATKRVGRRHSPEPAAAPTVAPQAVPTLSGNPLVTEPVTTAAPTLRHHHAAPRHADHAAAIAPAESPAPAPSGSAPAAAAAAGSAAAAAGFLALLALLAFAAPRLGGLIRLPEGRAPMPPLLALPERPG
jgi:hypothetical protein